MQSSALAEDVTAQEGVTQTLPGLYQQTLSEQRKMKTSDHPLFHIRLWGNVAPSGNIYRLNALIAERLKHSHDLWDQLREIAGAKSKLSGMPQEGDKEACAVALYEALQTTKVKNCPTADSESAKNMAGFKPLDEFLGTKVTSSLGLLLPEDEDEQSAYKKNLFVSLVIMSIQLLAPLLIFVNQWTSETNFMLDGYFWSKFEPRELFCLTDTLTEALTMFMGVLFLILVNIVIRSYVDCEISNLEKQCRLCLSRWWTLPNALANAWCCVMTVLVLPLLFWSELRPTDIVLDALGLLFIFTIDDLAGDAMAYLERDDTDFQRMAVWHTAFLSQCPVAVSDLINPSATSLQDVWQIRYNADGKLLKAGTDQPCQTRLHTDSDERTSITEENVSMRYHKNRTENRLIGHVDYLALWSFVRILLQILQWVIPPAWVILSQPCYGPGSVPIVPS